MAEIAPLSVTLSLGYIPGRDDQGLNVDNGTKVFAVSRLSSPNRLSHLRTGDLLRTNNR